MDANKARSTPVGARGCHTQRSEEQDASPAPRVMHAPVLSMDAQASGPCWHLGVASTMGEVGWASADQCLSRDRIDPATGGLGV